MTFGEAVVVAVDQGSSSTKALAVGQDGTVLGVGAVSLAEQHPQPGWVEQDPLEIRASVAAAVAQCLTGIEPGRVAAVGLSTQRESVVLWERATGNPVAPLVSWQDGRARDLADRLRSRGAAGLVQQLSGLPLDPMFSALKAGWLLDEHDPDRSRARRGDLCLGTVDSWLTSTTDRHVIELGNASRTQLLDLSTGQWSAQLLDLFDIPAAALPVVVASDGPFPALAELGGLLPGVPVTAVLGDSHAALFGSGVRTHGQVKATYGTGSSVMTLVQAADLDAAGLCRTIAWHRGARGAGSGPDGAAAGPPGPTYALEGNIRATGATLRWLARLLGTTPEAIAELADQEDSDGVSLVPGFGGLGAPWWDSTATGLLTGLTLGTGPAQVARAAVESMALQVNDVVAAARAAGAGVDQLLVDGGGSRNDTLVQLQADLSAVPVQRSALQNVSALGAAHLAGLTADVWDDATLASRIPPRDTFQPRMTAPERSRRLDRWHAAVAQSRTPPSKEPT